MSKFNPIDAPYGIIAVTPATALTAGGINFTRIIGGYFSSVTKDAAEEIVLIHANADY